MTIGIIYNTFSPNRIALFSSPINPSTQLPTISLQEAKKRFDTSTAIFIDARLHKNYISGHIEGAINIPYKDFEDKYLLVADFLPLDMEIIVYCSGSDCNASNMVAKNLINLGYNNVKVFKEGWGKWEAAGYPIAKGKKEDELFAFKTY
jgi:rhodanese-related sulfurtransferase